MLELKNITKDFEGLRAVNDVSLTVGKGEIVGLIGPNGSGKSTLLSLIAGTLRPTSGQIVFDGQTITRLSSDIIFHRGLARSFQDPSLFFQMTVLDNVLLPIKHQLGESPLFAPLWRKWKHEEQENAGRAMDVLKRMNLDRHAGKLASDLSGGQMKLLEMARSLMGNPKMLLLDEPTAGVAPALAYEIFQHIESLRRESGITFLIVEHRLEILFDFVDRVYVMHMGSLFAEGTPDDIAQNAAVREVYFGE